MRDSVEGGYWRHEDLGLSQELRERVNRWLAGYKNAHYHQCEDVKLGASLDTEGMEICREVRREFQLPVK